jgi:hypothetical protein
VAVTNNSYDALRTYLVERLLKLDPTLDASAGARMYAVVINPLLKRLGTDPMSVDMQSFITQRLRDEYPEWDVSTPGSALRDIIVSALVLFLTPLQREIEYLRVQKSLADYESLADDEMDALLANVLASRRTGAYAYGSVRVYFGAPKTVGIDSSISFATATGIRFIADEARSYLPSQMTRAGNLWYIDVPVRSSDPTTDANIGIGAITTAVGLDGVVRVANLAAIAGGVTPATNEEFLQQAQRSLTERSMNTKRGIETTIIENIAGITSVEIVGFGDPAMQRDILRATVVGGTPILPGEVLLSSAQFGTLPVVLEPASNYALPFTNILKLYNLTADQYSNLYLNAKYVRVLDGNSSADGASFIDWFRAPLLSRLREIDAIGDYDVGNSTAVIRLKDFGVYPAPATLGAPASATTTGTTAGLYAGLNTLAQQGIDYRLYATHDGHEYLTGAPLPFTDVMSGLDHTGAPHTALYGQDYLITYPLSSETSVSNSIYTGLEINRPLQPNRIAVWPIVSVLHANSTAVTTVRVGRLDSHLLRAKEIGRDAVVAGYPQDVSYQAVHEKLTVVAYGSPNGDLVDPLTAYAGDTVQSWERNPAVTLVASTGWVELEALPCTISFNGTSGTAAKPWADLGVAPGDYIALAFFHPVGTVLTGRTWSGKVNDASMFLLWQGWGRITELAPGGDIYALQAEGVDWTVLKGLDGVQEEGGVLYLGEGAGPAPFTAPYRLYWTVYKGARAVRNASTGEEVTSYDELNFLPAYRVPAASAYRVAARAPSAFNTDDALATFNHAGASSRLDSRASGFTLWMRLQRPFFAIDPSLAVSPAALNAAVNYTQLNDTTDVPAADPAGYNVPAATHVLYENARMPAANTAAFLTQATTSPFTEGENVTRVGGDYGSVAVQANPKGQSGYLLPFPYGYADSVSAPNPQELTGQIIQIYADGASTTPACQLTVSKVPAGVPSPEIFSGPITANNNEVHIGGCTDVYLKTASPVEGAIGALYMGDTDLADNSLILLTGADGVVDDTTSTMSTLFASAVLRAYLVDTYGLTAVSLPDLVVELLEPPIAALTPVAFRVLNIVAGSMTNVRIEGAFSGVGGAVAGLRWRLVRKASASLTAPIVLLQQGTDLTAYTNNPSVRILTGVVTSVSPKTTPLFLKILSGANAGSEYRVISRSGYTLDLAEPVISGGSGFTYQLYTKQSEKVSLPLVQVARVFLDDGASGVSVPIKQPVYLTLSSVAGWGSTLLTELDAGAPGEVVASTNTVFDANGYDFGAHGIRRGDVLNLLDANKQFFVSEVNTTFLTISPEVATSFTSSNYAVGTPAVGEVTVYFRAPTYFEVTGDTVFTHTDSTGRTYSFRPDPFRYGNVFTPAVATTDYEVSGTRLAVSTAVDDFFALNIQEGDILEVSTLVLTGTYAFNEVALSGHTLQAVIDGTSYFIKFTGSGLLTTQQVADAINQQAQAAGLYVVAEGTGPYYLKHYCRSPLQYADGTTGSLALLNLDETSNNALSDLAGDYTIATVEDTNVGGPYQLVVNSAYLPAGAVGKCVFAKIKRLGSQCFYPADMVLQDNGLYACKVIVTSYDPFLNDALARGVEVSINSAYRSLGYELLVENTEYSYSIGEKVRLLASTLVLDSTATSMAGAYVTPASELNIAYEYAPEVADAQAFMLRDSVRVTCNNPLVRHFLPAYPLFTLRYQGVSSPATVSSEVQTFLVSLYPNKTLEVFDLLSVLSRLNVTDVQGPVEVGLLCQDASRTWQLKLSKNSVSVSKEFHVMGELDYVTIERG